MVLDCRERMRPRILPVRLQIGSETLRGLLDATYPSLHVLGDTRGSTVQGLSPPAL
jgi:hypothetical protein